MWSLVPNAERNKKNNEDSRELDLVVARLYVILTIAVSRKCRIE